MHGAELRRFENVSKIIVSFGRPKGYHHTLDMHIFYLVWFLFKFEHIFGVRFGPFSSKHASVVRQFFCMSVLGACLLFK